MKVCSKCIKEKKLEEFPPNKRTKDGRGSWCKECTNTHAREWYSKNPKYNANRRYLYKYNISLDEYNQMYEEQGGKCAICNRHEETLDVDHNHITGEVRGLLCHQCNIGLGAYYDDITLLKNAIQYLREFTGGI